MSVQKWYEVSCDTCGQAEHFPIGLDYKIQARDNEWIVSKYGDFCDSECLSVYKNKLNEQNTTNNKRQS